MPTAFQIRVWFSQPHFVCACRSVTLLVTPGKLLLTGLLHQWWWCCCCWWRRRKRSPGPEEDLLLLEARRLEDRCGWSPLRAAAGGGGGRLGTSRASPAAAAEWAKLSEVLEKLLLSPARQGDGRWEDAHVHTVHVHVHTCHVHVPTVHAQPLAGDIVILQQAPQLSTLNQSACERHRAPSC